MLATTTAVVCRVTAGATGLLSTALDYSYYTAALASTLLCRKEKRKGAYPILRLQRYTHIDPNTIMSSLISWPEVLDELPKINHVGVLIMKYL